MAIEKPVPRLKLVSGERDALALQGLQRHIAQVDKAFHEYVREFERHQREMAYALVQASNSRSILPGLSASVPALPRRDRLEELRRDWEYAQRAAYDEYHAIVTRLSGGGKIKAEMLMQGVYYVGRPNGS